MSDLIPGLPEEIALECLTRLHHSTHRVSVRVCRRWQELLHSREFYHLRQQAGHTHKAVCLVQSLPVKSSPPGLKLARSLGTGITLFNTVTQTWHRLDPIPKYPDGLPLFCQMTASEGKLVVMGGWDPANYSPVRHVFVYDFTTQTWKQGRDMPENRSFFASASLNGQVVVAGGHDDNKNALDSAWAYDVAGDEWTELGRLSQGRDECEGVIFGSEFWVVSGYRTEKQGSFEGSADAYDPESGRWRRVENAWEAGRSPRSCVGLTGEGKLFHWGESDNVTAKTRMCAVDLGKSTFLCGSEYQGADQEFYIVGRQNGKSKRLDMPDEFVGFVQSGCSIEI